MAQHKLSDVVSVPAMKRLRKTEGVRRLGEMGRLLDARYSQTHKYVSNLTYTFLCVRRIRKRVSNSDRRSRFHFMQNFVVGELHTVAPRAVARSRGLLFPGEESRSPTNYNKIRLKKPTSLFLHFNNMSRPHAKLYGQLIVTFSLVCILVYFYC